MSFQAYLDSIEAKTGKTSADFKRMAAEKGFSGPDGIAKGVKATQITDWLKADFGLNGFCLDPFYATEAAFRCVMLAYNLMSLFRQALLQAPTAVKLSTMRFQCFALGAWVGKQGRKKVLRISLEARRRPWFEGLFGKIGAFRCPWPAPA